MDWKACSQPVKNAAGKDDLIPTLQCVPALLQNLITWAIYFAGIVAVVFVLISAYKLVMSRGDTKQVQSARQTLTWAIIGLVIVLISFTLLNLFTGIIGIDCLKNNAFGFNICSATK